MQHETVESKFRKKNPLYSFMAVEIEINHDCNRTCAYCPNSNTERKNQGRMSRELFVHILEQLRELEYEGRISYHFYNEPMLSPDLESFVALTKEYLPRCWIELYTNGSLLTEIRLRELSGLGVDKFTVTKHHGKDPYPFEELYEKLEPELQEKIKYQHYKQLILTSRGGLVRAGRTKNPPPLNLPCFIPSSVMVITVNGNVLPCYEDYNEQLVMGNIKENRILDVWNSPKYSGFRADLVAKKRFAHPVCKDCNCMMIIA